MSFFYTIINGAVLFTAVDPINGMGLWRSVGTEAGTSLIKDIFPDMMGGVIGNVKAVNNQSFFYVNANAPGSVDELWRSDGTETGTVYLSQNSVNIFDGSAPMTLHWFLPIGSKIVTDRTTSDLGREFWVFDTVQYSTLPLSLSDFKAQLSGTDGLLNWKTSSEQNTSHFEIERSIDGRNFIKIGTITAAGNSVIEKQYNYIDKNITLLGSPVIYYRLKTIDADGKSTYSKIIAININNKEAVVMLYPNPVHESATLMISVSKKEKITYSIIDQTGKTIQQNNISINAGSNTVLIETNSLAAGVYTLSLNGQNTTTQLKFMKQ